LRPAAPLDADFIKRKGQVGLDSTMFSDAQQIELNRRRAVLLTQRAISLSSNIDKVRSRLDSGEFAVMTPEEALAMVSDDSSSSSTSSRASTSSNRPSDSSRAPALLSLRLEVIAVGIKERTIAIEFPPMAEDARAPAAPNVVTPAGQTVGAWPSGFCDANAAAHQVGTPIIPHKAPPPPYAGLPV
jgi:hypothetical protein